MTTVFSFAPRRLALALGLVAPAVMAEPLEMEPLVVTEGSAEYPRWVESAPWTPATQYEVDAETFELLGAKGGTNPYTAASRLPGAQVQTVDAYGLVNPQGGNKGLRVRGEIAAHGANGTVEGVPLNGPGPGPGYLFLLDAENIDSVSMAQGAIPPDRFSLYDTAGQLDTRLLWPKEKAGGRISYGIGENDFNRQYLRLDSGRLPTGTAAFISASSSEADKWRGSGQSPESAETFALGLSQDLGRLDIKLFAARNDMAADNYKGLTYAQTQEDSDTWDDWDYDEVPTGTRAAELANWQGYNRQKYKTSAFLGEIGYQLGEQTRIVLKPFYGKEEGYYLYQNGNFVRRWDIDHTTYGATAELHTVLVDTALKFGYGVVSMEPPAPPTRWKHYTPAADGSLKFKSWALLADGTDRHEMHNLFVTAERRFGKLETKAGVRYVRDVLPSIDFYDTKGVLAEDFDEALAESSGVVDARSVRSTTIREWAPYFGVRYPLNQMVELRASAGRNIGSPAFDSFQKPAIAGLDKQDLWEASELELADTLDLAARFRFERGFIEPLLFYTRYRNKGVDIYDPTYNATYTQNIGEAHQLGLTLSGAWQVHDDVDLFGNVSFLRSQFDEDLQIGAGQVREVEGERLPDVPARMGTLGLSWRFYGNFTLTPVVFHMGKRYANIEHTQSMDAYTVTNLDLTHRLNTGYGELQTRVGVINLFDRRYIGFNNANETTNGSSFFPGAPRTVMASASFVF